MRPVVAGAPYLSHSRWGMGLAVVSLGWVAVSDVANVGSVEDVPGPDAVFLVDGRIGTACVNDKVSLYGVGALAGLSLASSSACRSEVAVFTHDHAMWLQDRVAWPDLGEGVTDVLLQPLVKPALNVWVPTSSSWTSDEGLDAATWAKVSVTIAKSVFGRNRVGMTFNRSVREYTGGQEGTVGNGCTHAAAVIAAGPPLYRPNAVNVYYVKTIEDYHRGYTCFESGAANVVYVALTATPEVTTTLAHELGHALGLQGNVGHINPGEFGATSSFVAPEENLMYNTTTLDIASGQWRFSLGQAYRMNVATRSWINQPVFFGSTAGPLRTGVTKICGNDPAQGRCPALWLSWP